MTDYQTPVLNSYRALFYFKRHLYVVDPQKEPLREPLNTALKEPLKPYGSPEKALWGLGVRVRI